VRRTKLDHPRYPRCGGESFGPIVEVKFQNMTEPQKHFSCLNCWTVQWEPWTKGWAKNGYCGQPMEHYWNLLQREHVEILRP
jgi:hypothetical protein